MGGREGREGKEGAPRTRTRSTETRATAPKRNARLRLELLARLLPELRERLLLRLLRRLERAMFLKGREEESLGLAAVLCCL